MARKGDVKPVLYVNVGLDQGLAAAVKASANRNERRWGEEVRYVLRQHYGVEKLPTEAPTDAVPA